MQVFYDLIAQGRCDSPCWNITSEAWVPSQVVHVGFVVERVALGRFMFEYFVYVLAAVSLTSTAFMSSLLYIQTSNASPEKEKNWTCKVHRTVNDAVCKVIPTLFGACRSAWHETTSCKK